jgi:adenine/guanine phosphoribosyltransferase-like PRPP-binding protein
MNTPHTSVTYHSGYFDEALFNLGEVIKKAERDLIMVDFDTMVGTGFSGSVVVPTLALAMGKKFALARKPGDNSHHGNDRLVGTLGERWLFVDDFVSSGFTRSKVIDKVSEEAEWKCHTTRFVGSYLYMMAMYNNNGFREPGEY